MGCWVLLMLLLLLFRARSSRWSRSIAHNGPTETAGRRAALLVRLLDKNDQQLSLDQTRS